MLEVLQLAIERYDVSDWINQSIILMLALLLIGRWGVKFKFRKPRYYY